MWDDWERDKRISCEIDTTLGSGRKRQMWHSRTVPPTIAQGGVS